MFFLFVLVTGLDMLWHLNGDVTEKIHHVVTLLGFACAWFASDLSRTMACYNGIAETVAPFYQLIKLGFSPTAMRLGAILSNARLPCMPEVIFAASAHKM